VLPRKVSRAQFSRSHAAQVHPNPTLTCCYPKSLVRISLSQAVQALAATHTPPRTGGLLHHSLLHTPYGLGVVL
jgi:hypothetical protein